MSREALQRVTAAAASARVGLALGTCFVEAADGKTYNQLRFYAADGAYLGFHSKTLPTGSMSAEPVRRTQPLRDSSAAGSFQFADHSIAGLICNDLWANPTCTPMPDTHLDTPAGGIGRADHLPRGQWRSQSRRAWSDVNWQFHSSNLRMRARASNIWIVTVDSCQPVDVRCSAPSGVIDPNGDWRCQTRDTGMDRFIYTIPA